MLSVTNWNKKFSKYPMTVEDKGWVYGVWYCGTAWQKHKLYGQYPPKFLDRVLALFPSAVDIIQCPSGTVTGPGICVDIQQNDIITPHIKASAHKLPFPDDSFDLYISDPPYSRADEAKYGTPPFSIPKAMKEAYRILKPHRYYAILHTYYPAYSRKKWELKALIAVVTGFQRQTRILSIFQSRKNGQCGLSGIE